LQHALAGWNAWLPVCERCAEVYVCVCYVYACVRGKERGVRGGARGRPKKFLLMSTHKKKS